MCRDLFYTSLTRLPSMNEAAMWDEFADHGRGVRLVFRVQPVLNRAELRPVRYWNPLLQTLIQELQEASQRQLHRPLVLMGISRIGGFYLPMRYDIEEEIRLLIKRFNVPGLAHDPWEVVQIDGVHQYLPLPLNQDNDFCRIDLIRVDAGPQRSRRDVDRELRKNPRFATWPAERWGCFPPVALAASSEGGAVDPSTLGVGVMPGRLDLFDRSLLDCCYIIVVGDGEVVDLTQNLADQHAQLKPITEAFAANGINHWRDGAVFHPATRPDEDHRFRHEGRLPRG